MRSHIKAITLVLATALLAGVMYMPQNKALASSGKEFSDVDLAPSSDGYKAIYWAVDRGITTGIKNTDKFAPEDACTRSQAVTFIWRLAGKPAPKSSKSSFSDIDAKFKKEKKDMYNAVLWATEKKIVAGYKDGTFRPQTKCTRAHIATFLYRYAGKPDQKKYQSKKSPFTDVKTSIGKDMYPAILWAKDKGITTGISGTKKFSPNGTCTRKQIVTFLWRYDGRKGVAPKATATPTPTEKPKGPDNTSYKRVTLDGVKEHSYVAKDYCFLESDKYIVFMEKDVEIPGDLKVNLDAIVDCIEEETGLSHEVKGYTSYFGKSSHYDTLNEPWRGWEVGCKIPVIIMVDRDRAGYISNAYEDAVYIFDDGLLSKDFWKTTPKYKDDPEGRPDYIEYDAFSHEMTHTITLRYRNFTSILTEGIAQYVGVKTVFDLAATGKYPSINEFMEHRSFDDGPMPEPINASNAEKYFIGDFYEENKTDARGYQYHYSYGRSFFEFLKKTYGPSFYKDFINCAIKNKLDYPQDGSYSEKAVKQYAATLKEVFGNDVFTRFGDWCVENNMLQKIPYIPDF